MLTWRDAGGREYGNSLRYFFFCNYEIISKQRVKQMHKVVVVILLSFISL